jgi:Zn-dependent protease
MMNKRLWMLLAAFLFSALVLIPSCAHAATVNTQLCLVIDGSGSINSNEWQTIIQAIAKAMEENIPHDGSVELTIVQFGYPSAEGYAKTELPPTIILDTNHAAIALQVSAMPKGDSNTPTAHGLYLGWSEIRNSLNFGPNTKRIINLATDDVPNIRNNNATTDLDGSQGTPNAKDDVIATLNNAVSQGLDELDVEAIGITETDSDWLKNWTVRPQPAIIAPPFTKAGWIRLVADPNEFASTIGQKMQVVITGNEDLWIPSAEGTFAAGIVTVGLTSLFSSLGSAISNPKSALTQSISNLLPDTTKKWLHEFISSKRKIVITPKKGNPFKLTKLELVSYAVALGVLTLAFAYAKAPNLNDILSIIPIILVTSIIVEFVKNFVVEVSARKLDVWTEHRLWYFGLATFLLSTLVFKVPFSSPSRNVHYSTRFTRRSLGLVSAASIFIGFFFAIIFYIAFINGFTQVGSIGLVMSLTLAFFEALPIPPMNGKDIYDWSKGVWATLFASTFTLYILCLLLM